jgi:glutamate-1-semialdehyde 2,1-aminomutase
MERPTGALERQYAEAFPRSAALFQRAIRLFPDGVTHVSRAMRPFPVAIDRAAGSRKWTIDGQEVIDYMVGHGSLLLGHSFPPVVEAVRTQMERGTHPGGSTELEVQWAEAVCRLVPGAERVRFVASGTEAAMMAVRLARLFTGRPRVLRFQGHFHGWSDGIVSESNPPYGQNEPGVPAPEMACLPPGDLEAVDVALAAATDVAAVILEPTGGHWGEVPLGATFLRGLREITMRRNVLLICDEVITGFRVAPGGAQEKFGVRADLTVLAKVLAGGLPGGAVAGREAIMDLLSSSRPGPRLRHPGTFNANPLSAAAGVTALREVASGEPQRRADAVAAALRVGMNRIIREEGVRWRAYGTFSDFHIVTEYDGPQPDDDAFLPCDAAFERLSVPPPAAVVEASRQAMLLEGVDWFGLRGMTSAAHTDEDVDRTLAAFRRMLERLRREGLV